MASVTFDKATRVYPGADSPAVDALDLEIEDGEFLVLVGPSGCGKSTSLRMLAGLEEVNSGRILIGDKDVTHVQPKDRDIAMVFQNYALYPHMTVFQNMAFSMKLAGAPKEVMEREVQKAAKILGLEMLLHRFPRQLSGGQRQRVAMGRAIVRQPQVFLFDEPLSNLDAKLRAHTRLEIQKLHRELGITSLFVTHDQVEAMTLAQRMIVMNGGVMEQFGSPEEVYARPASTFVATFIGSPPMNLIKSAPGAKPGITVGIRPEHLDVTPDGWALTVDALEMLGAERLVYGRWQHGEGDELVIIRCDEALSVPQLGSTIHVTPRADRLHHFDTATGKRI